MALTVSSLRHRHRAQALELLVYSGPLSRSSLGDRLELSSGAVTNVVEDLISDGLVVEQGSQPTRGRPVSMLVPNHGAASFLGVELGERDVAVELFDLGMNRLTSVYLELDEERADPAAVGKLVRRAVTTALETPHGPVQGMGLALPGAVETVAEGEPILHAPSLGWTPVPVSVLMDNQLPVYPENATSVTALAEQRFNRSITSDHFAVAYIGRWVGLGVVINGTLVRGSRGMAGQWGHTTVERGGPTCRCGSQGCLEALIGSDALLAAWVSRGGHPHGSGWDQITQLCESAVAGDAAAREVVTTSLDTLGLALGNVATLLNPEHLVVSGWVGLRLMHFFPDELADAVRRHTFAPNGQQLSISPSSLGGDTTATGAALLPLSNFLRRIETPDPSTAI
ncbi:MAG TPA: ROK family protein [Propionibacteriaceae bacterium]|nr:ROK family protein [Propionibacteriaceae bacterium]